MSDSSFDFGTLPDPIVNYGIPQQPQQQYSSAQAQGYARQPCHQQKPSGHEDQCLPGQRQHSPQQTAIPIAVPSRREGGAVLRQSSHPPVSPQQQPSPTSPVTLSDHTSSPARQSQ